MHTALTLHPTAWLRGRLREGAQCSLGTGRKDPPSQPYLTRPVCLQSSEVEVPQVLWTRIGLSGPGPCTSSEQRPTQWTEGPPCSHPTGHTVAPAVPAPGPRVADGLPEHRRCGDRCQRASRHSHNWKTNILFLRHTFRPAHTQDGTCETTSLSAWREENSLPNKS